MINGYTSVKTVIAKVYRDLNLQEEDRWVSMVEWAAEALLFIGAFPQFKPKDEIIDIEGYKGSLPCDYYKTVQVMYGTIPLTMATGSFDFTDDCDDCHNLKTRHTFVYSINDSYIFTNFKNGQLCLSYLAFPVDEDGFPLIPDNVSYREAVYHYIVKKLFYPDYISGKLNPNIYQDMEAEWDAHCMQARGKANMPDVDKMQSIMNQFVRLIPDINAHSAGFTTLNAKEKIRLGKH